jgi:hypothetical protein
LPKPFASRRCRVVSWTPSVCFRRGEKGDNQASQSSKTAANRSRTSQLLPCVVWLPFAVFSLARVFRRQIVVLRNRSKIWPQCANQSRAGWLPQKQGMLSHVVHSSAVVQDEVGGLTSIWVKLQECQLTCECLARAFEPVASSEFAKTTAGRHLAVKNPKPTGEDGGCFPA